MLKSAKLAGVAIGAAAILCAQAAAQPSGDVAARGLSLVQAGRAAEAYALLVGAAPQRAGDPSFDYALALAALDTGRPAEAMIALQRVLARQPNNGPARAELARAYAMVGDADTARREFDTVVGDPTIPDPVRQRFTRIIDDLDRTIAGGGTSVTGFEEGGVGYDSNVNSATALDSMVIPLFAGLGPASLSAGAIETDDAFGRLEGGVSVVHGLSRQSRVFGSLLGSVKQNFEEEDFNQASLVATGGLARNFVGGLTVSAAAQAQRFWFGGDAYRESYGLTLQGSKALGDGSALNLTTQYFQITYPDDPLRDGERVSFGLSRAGRTSVVALQAGRESADDATGDHYSHSFLGLSGAIEAPLREGLALTASLAGEGRDHDSFDPLFLKAREDRQIDVSLGLKMQVSPRAILRPQVTYTDNRSNIALYDYQRTTAAVTLRTEF